jgi:SSS family solute:Na+ symporter
VVAMIVATVNAVILVFWVDDLWLAHSFGGVYPLPAGYADMGAKALSGTVFPIKLIIAVVVTTVAWIATTLLTKPESTETLRSFYRLTRPGGPGWKKVVEEARADGDMIDEKDHGVPWEMPIQILLVFVGCVVIYASLFSIGSFVYQRPVPGFGMAIVAVVGTYFLFTSFKKVRAD